MLVDELRRRGVTVAVAVWNDPASIGARRGSVSSVRHGITISATTTSSRWIARADSLTVVKNDPHLLRWNAHKSYLRDLERLGVPIVPTRWVRQGEPASLREIAETSGWESLVLKPARGAASHGVTHVRGDAASHAAGQECLDELLTRDDALVQPYLEAVVSYGERALIFLRGALACRGQEAVRSNPRREQRAVVVRRGDPATRSRSRRTPSRPCQERPLYARVDLINDDEGSVRVSELELIEPTLYFALHEPARLEFAAAVERELALSS